MNIYHINSKLEDLLTAFEEEGSPELDESIKILVKELDYKKTKKFEWIVKKIRNEMAMEEAIKGEKQALEKRLKSKRGEIDRLKSFLSDNFSDCKGADIPVPFHFSQRTDVEVFASESLPAWAFIHQEPVQPPPKVDKAEIKSRLKEGESVEGAVLSTKTICVFPKGKGDSDE